MGDTLSDLEFYVTREKSNLLVKMLSSHIRVSEFNSSSGFLPRHMLGCSNDDSSSRWVPTTRMGDLG